MKERYPMAIQMAGEIDSVRARADVWTRAALDPARAPLQRTAYDTVWLAHVNACDGVLEPGLVAALVSMQNDDGSWGSRAPHAHDRALSTVAMLIFLARTGGAGLDSTRRAAERYLAESAGALRDEEPTVGFELLLPTLVEQARPLKIALPYGAYVDFDGQRLRKLALLPESIFRTPTSALFSLEAFSGSPGVEQAAELLLPDGSMMGSPSATAFLMSRLVGWRDRHPRTATYLDGLAGSLGGLPQFAPSDVMMAAWMLDYLHLGGLLEAHRDAAAPHYARLRDAWSDEGAGFASTPGSIPDGDDTAVSLAALHHAGWPVDALPLLRFEREREFVSYPFERHGSVTTNLHALQASDALPREHRARVREKVLRYVAASRRQGAFWTDKWHASPFYPTTRALMLLPAHGFPELEATVRWLVERQREDGGWGWYGSTAEETAMVLLALLRHLASHPASELRAERRRLDRGAAYLLRADPEAPAPELWLAKVNYAPRPIIAAVVAAALARYAELAGGDSRSGAPDARGAAPAVLVDAR